MPKLPPLKHCLLAEFIKPESNGKFTLLGFFGVAPSVTIRVQSFPARIDCSVLLLCAETTEKEIGRLEVSVSINKKELISRAPLPEPIRPAFARGQQEVPVALALNFQQLSLTESGECVIDVYSEGEFHSSSHFNVDLVL
jgi:hypothetical protein